MDKNVKNDGKALTELLGLDEGTLEHQGNYCFMASKDDQCVDIWTEPADETGETIRVYEVEVDGEPMEFCVWCGELYPASEMAEEQDMGYLCEQCQRGITSRGEKIIIR